MIRHGHIRCMPNQKVDVLVIGGGIIGTTVARELQARGRQVLIVERGGIAAGSSYGNAGWVTPCFAMPLPQPGMFFKSIGWLLDPNSPLYIHPELSLGLARWMIHFLKAMNQKQMEKSIGVLTEISKYSLDFYEQLAKRSKPEMSFEQKGLLMVSATESGLKDARMELELMQKQGVTGRNLGRDELLAFEPCLKSQILGGVFFDREAHVEPFSTTLAVHQEFTDLGGKSLLNTEVFDFETDGNRITSVQTTRGNFSPELVVMAAGAWSPSLVKSLKIKVPILGGKGYSMSIPDSTAEGIVKPQRPIMIIERKIAVTPRHDSTRIAGTLELVNQDFGISPNRVRNIQRGADEYMHMQSQGNATDIWRGLRPCTPDGVPVISYSERWSNLFYNTGHQMLGLQSAPGSARLAADLIMKENSIVDPAPFSARRFE